MNRAFDRTAGIVSNIVGRPSAFVVALLLVLLWGISGPLFGFSDTWQLVINTGTTIVTFLMVFLIQNTQNRDGAAVQAKLDELIRVGKAKNEFIGIEHLSAHEVEEFRRRCETAAKVALQRGDGRHRHRTGEMTTSGSSTRSGRDIPAKETRQ